jgi:hypothetical protein
VNLNTSHPPLLRLPGEVCNKIWDLAMGGNYIQVPGGYDTIPKGNAISNPTWPEYVPLSAFHLPEFCHQIHSGTAVLAYKLNIFVIGIGIGRSNKKWIKNLLPTQRDAITAIAPTEEFLDDYICGTYKKSMKDTFPNLEFIEVTESAFSRVRCYGTICRGTEDFSTPEEWEEWEIRRIQKKEGDDIEIEFGDAVEMPKVSLDSDDDSESEMSDDEGDEPRMTLEEMVVNDLMHADEDWVGEEAELSEDSDDDLEDEPEIELLP